MQQCIAHIQQRDWEGALVNLFPAIDNTAKRRRPRDGVGARIKSFLEEEEGLVSCVATGSYMKGIYVNGVSIPDALYKFCRTTIVHEGELDPRLNFSEGAMISISNERWNLPVGFIAGLSVAVIAAPENSEESIAHSLTVSVMGQQFQVNQLWGRRDLVRNVVAERLKRPDLFED